MTPAMEQYLKDLGKQGRAGIARTSAMALRDAWPNRHTSGRAPHVIHANVRMLRGLKSF